MEHRSFATSSLELLQRPERNVPGPMGPAMPKLSLRKFFSESNLRTYIGPIFRHKPWTQVVDDANDFMLPLLDSNSVLNHQSLMGS